MKSTDPETSRIFPNTQIGNGALIDPNVLLGYRTGRQVLLQNLIIGNNAAIRSGTVIYTNTVIGDGLQTGHNVIIREENLIGCNFNIWNNSCIDYGSVIGDNVKIHNNCYIAQFSKIGNNVFLAPGVIFGNDPCPVCTKCMQGPTLCDNVRIGVNCTILPKVIIGANSLIGAGSVVTRDIPENSLAYGNPARVVKNIHEMKCKEGIREFAYPR